MKQKHFRSDRSQGWIHILHPRDWSILIKLSIALLVAALVPMSLTTYFNMRRSLESVENTEYRNLELLATITANRLDQLTTDTQRVVVQVSANARVVELLLPRDSQIDFSMASAQEDLDSILRSNSDYSSIFILDKTGFCLLSTNPENLNKKYNFREYFQEAIQGKLYTSDIIVGTTTKQPGLYFSAPVRDNKNRVIGVAVLKLKGEKIWEVVENLRVGSTGYAFLIDQYGIIISHPQKNLLYSSLATLPPETLKQLSTRFSSIGISQIKSLELPELARDVVGAKKTGHSRYLSNNRTFDRSTNEILGFAPLEKQPWVVGISESEVEFTAPLKDLENQARLIFLMVGGGVAVLALLLARSIIQPIQAITKAARLLEQEDFAAAHVKVYSQDEVGVLAQTFNLMANGLKERQREREIFGRVVSPAVREKLLNSQLELGGETRWVSVLFSDIRGFSSISEQMSPQAVVALLNEYLTEMTEAIRGWDGYINNFIGDAIVVIFGAPVEQQDAERRSVAAALTMRERLEKLNQRRMARGEMPIESGIGISTGEVVAGQIGSLERLLYTVIGDAVNVSARLENLTKEYPEYHILINGSTASAIAQYDEVLLAELGLIKVKGRDAPVEVWAVKGWKKQDSLVQNTTVPLT